MKEFRQKVLAHYDKNGRDMPWRHLSNDQQLRLYQVVVSELMLQQTQVTRVTLKYQCWMKRFPSMQECAESDFSDILAEWQGLGYMRRARYLHDICKQLTSVERATYELLCSQKGIGPNTAAAIMAYTYNEPLAFVETNIRTVYIHEFFHDMPLVSDSDIREAVNNTMDRDEPRIWFWALMDYGSYLKKTGKRNHQSAHYVRQSAFEGSNRQLRAKILKAVLQSTSLAYDEVLLRFDDARSAACIDALVQDGLLRRVGVQLQVHK